MGTDKSFYEWGKLVPGSVAHLAGLDPTAGWRWTSVTVKGLERRLDGVLEPSRPGLHFVFVEVQGYLDHKLMGRWLQSILTFLDQKDFAVPLIPLVLYVRESHEAADELKLGWGQNTFLLFRPQAIILSNLTPQMLLELDDVGLLPLLPLTAITASELKDQAPRWAGQIRSTEMDPILKQDLIGLLGAFLSHRLPKLKLDDIGQLLGGSKVEDTPLGQMLMEKGREEGIEKGREEGIEKGIEKGRALVRTNICSLVRHRLGQVPAWLEPRLAEIQDLQGLQRLFERALDLESEDQLLQFLDVAG